MFFNITKIFTCIFYQRFSKLFSLRPVGHPAGVHLLVDLARHTVVLFERVWVLVLFVLDAVHCFVEDGSVYSFVQLGVGTTPDCLVVISYLSLVHVCHFSLFLEYIRNLLPGSLDGTADLAEGHLSFVDFWGFFVDICVGVGLRVKKVIFGGRNKGCHGV